MTTKLFIGNVPQSMTSDDLVHMFEPYGEIVECDIVKNYAFLHYTQADSAAQAAKALNGTKFDNNVLRVEVSHSKPASGQAEKPRSSAKTTKLFVGNVPASAKAEELKRLFDTYGKVVECDIVRDFAFVHYEHEQEADLAADMLNNTDFCGSFLSVERSHNNSRKTGDTDSCFNCGKSGHKSKDCRNASSGRSHGAHPPPPPGRYAPAPLPPVYHDPYREELYDELREYRARYGPLERYRPPLPPSPRSYPDVDPYSRERRVERPVSYRDPYERPPPYYYEEGRRANAYDTEERYRYVVRSRDELPRRRVAPPY